VVGPSGSLGTGGCGNAGGGGGSGGGTNNNVARKGGATSLRLGWWYSWQSGLGMKVVMMWVVLH